MKKYNSYSMSPKYAVFLFIIGILLGSVFTFGMQYWNKNVARKDCTIVKTQFLSYDENRHRGHIQEIAIDCADGNRYFIDGVVIDKKLLNKLSSLHKNKNITLLIHPNSNTIVEFSIGKNVLLNFDETITKLGKESYVFLFLGIFMYFCALVGLCYTVHHITLRRKSDNKWHFLN